MEILLIVQIIVVVALIAVILVQRSDSDGFTGNSDPSSFMTGRAQANLFTKTTSILATIFIVNSLVLGYLAAHTERTSDIIDSAIEEKAKDAEVKAEGEAVDAAPKEIKDVEVPVEEEVKKIEEKASKEVTKAVDAAKDVAKDAVKKGVDATQKAADAVKDSLKK